MFRISPVLQCQHANCWIAIRLLLQYNPMGYSRALLVNLQYQNTPKRMYEITVKPTMPRYSRVTHPQIHLTRERWAMARYPDGKRTSRPTLVHVQAFSPLQVIQPHGRSESMPRLLDLS